MTLDKAVKYLEDSKQVFIHKGELEYAEADQLGIEALERVEMYQKSPLIGNPLPLPSETED